MSESPTTTPLPPDDLVSAEAALETASPPAGAEVAPAPTLITEQQVIFSTAAAGGVASTRHWTRATRAVVAAIRRIFPATPQDSRPKRRYYPPRTGFLDDSRMEREMHRL